MTRRIAIALVLVVLGSILLGAAGLSTGLLRWSPLGPDAAVYASDRFARELNQRWGSAETGGSYEIGGGDGRVDVDGDVGTMYLPEPGASKTALLPDVMARDVDIRLRIAWDKWPTGGRQFVYTEVRVQPDMAYVPKMVLAPNGGVEVNAGVIVAGLETELGATVTVTGLRRGAGEYIWFRAVVVGVDPTKIFIRAWADGLTEPTVWQYTASDATPALQAPGAIGLRAYLGSRAGNPPATVSFDDLLVTGANATETAAVETR